MGRSAGLGLTIGVLSGAGNQKFLEKEADVVLNNVDELLNTLFPTDSSSSSSWGKCDVLSEMLLFHGLYKEKHNGIDYL